MLYLSRFIISNKNDYYERLLAVTAEGEWTRWVEYMLEGVRQTAQSTLLEIDAIRDLQEVMKVQIGTVLSGGGHIGLLDVLFEQTMNLLINDEPVEELQSSSRH